MSSKVGMGEVTCATTAFMLLSVQAIAGTQPERSRIHDPTGISLETLRVAEEDLCRVVGSLVAPQADLEEEEELDAPWTQEEAAADARSFLEGLEGGLLDIDLGEE